MLLHVITPGDRTADAEDIAAALSVAGYATTATSRDADLVARLSAEVDALLDADGLALLPGWSESPSAVLDVEVALALGRPVVAVEEWLDAVTLPGMSVSV